MDEVKYDPKNIFDANKSAVKRAFNSAEEFIDIAFNNKPTKLKDINIGNARDILGVTPGGAEELKKQRKRKDH